MKARKKPAVQDNHEITPSEQRAVVRTAFAEGAMASITAVQAVLRDAYKNPKSRLKNLTPYQLVTRYAESIHASVMTNYENDKILREMDESQIN